jgi:hypothetical protein
MIFDLLYKLLIITVVDPIILISISINIGITTISFTITSVTMTITMMMMMMKNFQFNIKSRHKKVISPKHPPNSNNYIYQLPHLVNADLTAVGTFLYGSSIPGALLLNWVTSKMNWWSSLFRQYSCKADPVSPTACLLDST